MGHVDDGFKVVCNSLYSFSPCCDERLSCREEIQNGRGAMFIIFMGDRIIFLCRGQKLLAKGKGFFSCQKGIVVCNDL